MQWTTNQLIGNAGAPSAPALAVHRDRLWCLWVGSDRSISARTYDGSRWSGRASVRQATNRSPALAELDGRLHMVFTANSSSMTLLHATLNDADDSWSVRSVNTPPADGGDGPPGVGRRLSESTKCSPALAAHNGKLYCAFVANDSSNAVLYCVWTPEDGWRGNYRTGEAAWQTPALVDIDGTLHLIFAENNPQRVLLDLVLDDAATDPHKAWHRKQRLNASSSAGGVSATALGPTGYLLFPSNDSRNEIRYSTYDSSWSSDLGFGQTTNDTPSSAVFDGALHTVFIARDNTRALLWSVGEANLYGRTAVAFKGVDNLAAVPQWYVNASLTDLLDHGSTTTGGSLREISLRRGTDAEPWLFGRVGRLTTRVYLPDQPSAVVLAVDLDDGTLRYGSGNVSACDASGLRFGLRVDLARSAADAGPIPAGALTAQRLLSYLQDAAAVRYDPQATAFPSGMPDAAVTAFPQLITDHLRQCADVGKPVLGYAVAIPDRPDPMATFPPTSTTVTTNQYRGSEPGARTDPDADTITYLTMTGGAPMPAAGTWWGNLVLPTDGVDSAWYGTSGVRKHLFLDGFLLPGLADLVCAYWQLGSTDNGIAPQYTARSGALNPAGLGGSWRSGALTGRSKKSSGGTTDQVDYTFSWSVDVTAVPGRNEVVVNRNVAFDIHLHRRFGIIPTDEWRVWYEVPLRLTVTLLGVMDGRLQVSVDRWTREPDPDGNYSVPYGWYVTKGQGILPSDLRSEMSEVMRAAASAALLPPDIHHQVTDRLNAKPFVVPWAAQLSLLDPVVTDRADLLFGLNYKA